MTRQEAVELLKPFRDCMTDQYGCPISDVVFALDVAIKALEQEPSRATGKWIPVSERLPENDEKVLCQTVTKKGQINMVIGFYDFDRWCCGMNSNVTAWMPLPEPYKAREEK